VPQKCSSQARVPALHVLVSHEKNHHRQECVCHRSVHRRRGQPALHVRVSHEKNHHRQECVCHRSVHRRRGLLRPFKPKAGLNGARPAVHVLVSHQKNHHRQECVCHRSVHRRRGRLRSTCLLVSRKTITGKSAGATKSFIAGEGFSAHSSQKRA
jgi:hypothetical protein